jgi:excisionase family DNA binding protein
MLRLSQVAERLNVSVSTVYALASSGKLPVIATGAGGRGYRVTESDLQAFIEGARRVREEAVLPTNIRHLRLESSSRGRRGTSGSAKSFDRSLPR